MAVTDEYKKVSCIAQSAEKYMTFTLNQLSFFDSAQHMMGALQSLAGSLSSCPITEKYFNPSLVRKGVYPYEYMDSWERFDEESLPPKELSKLLMLEFLYDYFKPLYPDSRVLYTDTDSFILDIPTEDFYKDMMHAAPPRQSIDMEKEAGNGSAEAENGSAEAEKGSAEVEKGCQHIIHESVNRGTKTHHGLYSVNRGTEANCGLYSVNRGTEAHHGLYSVNRGTEAHHGLYSVNRGSSRSLLCQQRHKDSSRSLLCQQAQRLITVSTLSTEAQRLITVSILSTEAQRLITVSTL
ncbi:hypothetical protein ACOMHN_021030 [Nucella lapillus]